MYRTFILLFFSILFSLSTSGQQRKASVNLSLWPPVATAPVDSNRFTVANIGLYSLNYELKGAGLNVMAHTVESSARGAMVSGLLNVVKGHFHGFQLAGIQNTNAECAHGLTIAGMTNFAIGDASGVQIAGAVNMAGTRFRGMQISPAVNITGALSGGVQLAAITNISAEGFWGVQLGAGNYAGTMRGVQMGIINLCGGEVHGVQVGVINHSKDTSTVKLGLVNINPNTRIQMMVYGGNTTKFNTGVRFTNNKLYTIIGLGTHYLDMNEDFSGSLFYRAGAIFPLRKRLALSADLGYSHIENFEQEDAEKPERLFSLQGRVNLEYQLLKNLAIMGSVGYANTRYYYHNRFFEQKPVFELGLILF